MYFLEIMNFRILEYNFCKNVKKRKMKTENMAIFVFGNYNLLNIVFDALFWILFHIYALTISFWTPALNIGFCMTQ